MSEPLGSDRTCGRPCAHRTFAQPTQSPSSKRIDCASVPVKFKDGTEHFVAVIPGKSEVDPLCSLDLNILVQEVGTAGYQSIAQKREISLS